jgi:hypothetical protein
MMRSALANRRRSGTKSRSTPIPWMSGWWRSPASRRSARRVGRRRSRTPSAAGHVVIGRTEHLGRTSRRLARRTTSWRSPVAGWRRRGTISLPWRRSVVSGTGTASPGWSTSPLVRMSVLRWQPMHVVAGLRGGDGGRGASEVDAVVAAVMGMHRPHGLHVDRAAPVAACLVHGHERVPPHVRRHWRHSVWRATGDHATM